VVSTGGKAKIIIDGEYCPRYRYFKTMHLGANAVGINLL